MNRRRRGVDPAWMRGWGVAGSIFAVFVVHTWWSFLLGVAAVAVVDRWERRGPGRLLVHGPLSSRVLTCYLAVVAAVLGTGLLSGVLVADAPVASVSPDLGQAGR